MPPILFIVGKSQAGKTTLIEKLIPHLKKRGYKIGTIKHAHHGFDVDKKGKDSRRHQEAGADTVLVASPGKIAMVKKDAWQGLEDLTGYFQDMDLIITEGFKRVAKPKIEIFRSVAHKQPFCLNDENLIAFVTDTDFNVNVPTFGLEDILQIADFIEKNFLGHRLSAVSAK
jgi:molybdopterin-guanine dinucleotide biosynthesis protein B